MARFKQTIRHLLGARSWERLRRLHTSWRRHCAWRTRDRAPQRPVDQLWQFCRYDFDRLIEHSSAVKGIRNQAHWRAQLMVQAHKIEKALSLKEPKRGFGGGWIANDFVPLLRQYLERFGNDDTTRICRRTLQAYKQFHANAPADHPDLAAILASFADLGQGDGDTIHAATRVLYKADLRKALDFDYEAFVRSRASLRNFTALPVDRDLIEKAIAWAKFTPSACNRQAWNVKAFDDPEKIATILRFQPGNRGFGEHVRMLLLITADLSQMHHPAERNQPWIDAGMFAMSVVYALHALGLGACCLNLSVDLECEAILRHLVQVPAEWSLVMLLAVGHWPETVHVAHSERRPLAEILHWDTSGQQVDA